MNLKNKAAIYIRVSTHWQVDKDSLQVQERELTAYSSIVLNIKDYEIFRDAGYSAKNTDRPDYQAMIKRIRSGEFSHLIVWKIDRISRNLLDFASMYSELKDLGVTFVSKNEQFDTSSAIGEAMLKIILVFAELERNMTSERVTAVMLSRANNGQWNGGRVPYGYTYDKESQTFKINESEAQIVRRIFNDYNNGISIPKISEQLIRENLVTRSGTEWPVATIGKMLRNQFYAGYYIYNVRRGIKGERHTRSDWTISENHHQQLIDTDLFNTVQSKLSLNKRGGNQYKQTRTRTHTHVFSGLLECGICGSNMSASPGKKRSDGWNPSTYGCAAKKKISSCCSNTYISDKTLAPFIMAIVSNIINSRGHVKQHTTTDSLQKRILRGRELSNVKSIDQDSLSALLKLIRSGSAGIEYNPISIDESSTSEIDCLNDQKRKLDIALSRLKSVYLYSDENIPESEYIVERKKIIDKISEIESKISSLSSCNTTVSNEEYVEMASYYIMVQSIKNYTGMNMLEFYRSIDPEVIKQFMTTIINKIIITKGLITSITLKNGITIRLSYK